MLVISKIIAIVIILGIIFLAYKFSQWQNKLPEVEEIETKEDYNIAIQQINTYLTKRFSNLTPEEKNDLQQLFIALEKYEYKQYPIKSH